MVITLGTSLLVLSLLNGVTAFVNETGFGGPGNTDGNDTLKGPLLLANQHPLNESRTNFPGFNLDTDPGSSDNATTPTTNWTMRAGLGLLDVASGRTGYPVSAATNTSTNLINLAFSLEFPREKLPSPNDTDWSLCAFSVLGDPWNQDILRKAIDDPGDCSNVLGASCFDALHRYLQQTMTPTTGIGCPSGIFLSTIDECKSFPAGTVGSSGKILLFFHNNALVWLQLLTFLDLYRSRFVEFLPNGDRYQQQHYERLAVWPSLQLSVLGNF